MFRGLLVKAFNTQSYFTKMATFLYRSISWDIGVYILYFYSIIIRIRHKASKLRFQLFPIRQVELILADEHLIGDIL